MISLTTTNSFGLCVDQFKELMMLKFTSPVQTELTHCPQDVRHALSPQLLAKDGGGNEAASSTNTSTADRDQDS